MRSRCYVGVLVGSALLMSMPSFCMNTVAVPAQATVIEDGKLMAHDCGYVRVVFNEQGTQALTFSRVGVTGRRPTNFSEASVAKLWNLVDRTLITTLSHEDTVLSGNFSRNSSRIITCSVDGKARIWNSSTGERVCEFQFGGMPIPGDNRSSEPSPFCQPALNSDGSRAMSVDKNSTTLFWNGSTEKFEAQNEWGDTLGLIRFSNDDTKLSISDYSSGSARIISLTDEFQQIDLDHFSDYVEPTLNNEGTKMAACTSGTGVRIWGIPNTEQRIDLEHEGTVLSVVFTHDSTHLITYSSEGKIRFWNVSDGSLALIIEDIKTKAISSVALSPDGTTLVLAPNERKVQSIDKKKIIRFTGPGFQQKQEYEIPAGTSFTSCSPDGTRVFFGKTGATMKCAALD